MMTCATASAAIPMLRAELLQQRGIAGAALAEAEVIAGDHPRSADAIGDDVRDELPGIHRRQLAVELEHQHGVRSGVREQLLALVEAGQPEWWDVGLEEMDRVRVEGGDDHRPPLVEAALDRPVHHRLVAEVESVEIAEGDDAPLEVLRDAAGEGQALH